MKVSWDRAVKPIEYSYFCVEEMITLSTGTLPTGRGHLAPSVNVATRVKITSGRYPKHILIYSAQSVKHLVYLI